MVQHTKVKMHGELRYPKLFTENREKFDFYGEMYKRDKNFLDDEAGIYKLDIVPSDLPKAKKDMKASASMKRLKEKDLDDGTELRYYTFDRWHKQKSEKAPQGPPRVIFAGKEITRDDGLIGNGSEAEVEISVSGPYGEGDKTWYYTTLEKVTLTKWMKYDPDTKEATEVDPDEFSGKPKSEPKEDSPKDLEDEIPF